MLQNDIEQVDFDVSMDKFALDGCENVSCFFDFVNGILRELAGSIFVYIYKRERKRDSGR